MGGSVLWELRGLMLKPDSPYIAVNARFAEPKQVKIGIETAAAVSFPARTSQRH